MKIKWFGHSAFGLTSESGKIVLTDPYEPNGYNGAVRYKPITVNADAVTISHNHPDHNYTRELTGNPKIVTQKEACEIAGIRITGIPTFHDSQQGKKRGGNIIFVYEIDDLRIAHCGDLGHILSDKETASLGRIDIVLIPIGGNFTIDAAQATDIIEKIKPKIAIPMHYKTEVLDFPISGVDELLNGKNNIKRASTSEVSITIKTLPTETEIWILPYHQ